MYKDISTTDGVAEKVRDRQREVESKIKRKLHRKFLTFENYFVTGNLRKTEMEERLRENRGYIPKSLCMNK